MLVYYDRLSGSKINFHGVSYIQYILWIPMLEQQRLSQGNQQAYMNSHW